MPRPNFAGVEGSILFDSSAGHIRAKRGDSKIMKMALAEPNCAAVNSMPKSVRSVALSANKVIDPPDCSNIDQNIVLITMRKRNYAKGGSTENSGAGLMARGAVL